ncbi:MAG: SCO family protein [Bacteroidetes bacterium]|nr:MAG: SCO family protein [Bacteroidota bacterium]
MKNFFLILVAVLFFHACDFGMGASSLPRLGQHKIDKETGDTTYHTIPDFQFINQDSMEVTNETFKGKVYIVDFFFTSCPTICPKTAQQMLRLYKRYEDDDRVSLLAHSIDTKRDTVARLKEYANSLEVSAPKWHFVTGNKAEIYEIADDYMSIAIEDPDAPGGFDHSGWFILIDENRYIRSFCNGTDPESVDKFMKDIDWLLENM